MVNSISNFFPKKIRLFIKYFAEFFYWYWRSKFKGIGAFFSEESSKRVFSRYCNMLEINKDTFKDRFDRDRIACSLNRITGKWLGNDYNKWKKWWEKNKDKFGDKPK